MLAPSGFGPAHVILVVFANPGESQATEIAQLNFRSSSEVQVAFEVPEHALDALSLLSRPCVGLGVRKCAYLVAGVLGNKAGDGALPRRCALRFKRARGAVRGRLR
ncbi:hypothetical protein HMP09_p0028 (plasmid) [Sphingomonas sp. HMP9]|nr:hypothetical protein HMP09_p0028 [Sphingomonas sp. HMP9]